MHGLIQNSPNLVPTLLTAPVNYHRIWYAHHSYSCNNNWSCMKYPAAPGPNLSLYLHPHLQCPISTDHTISTQYLDDITIIICMFRWSGDLLSNQRSKSMESKSCPAHQHYLTKVQMGRNLSPDFTFIWLNNQNASSNWVLKQTSY